MSGNSQEVDNAEDSYPTQRHAGKVGYGPTYHEGPVCISYESGSVLYSSLLSCQTIADKVAGYKKELHGKIARKPQLVKEGHDKITGEAKRREKEGSDVCHNGHFSRSPLMFLGIGETAIRNAGGNAAAND